MSLTRTYRWVMPLALILGLVLAALPAPAPVFAAGEKVSGGDNSIGSWNYASGLAMGSSAGSTLIATTTMTDAGTEYFRFHTSSGAGYAISVGVDSAITFGSKITSLINVGTSGSLTFTSSAGKTYVFKWGSSAGSEGVVFELGGTPVTIVSTSRSPSGTVWPGSSVMVNATLSASLVTGQGAYIRYSIDNFTNSTVAAMSCTGTSCSATIPAQSAGATVKYYLFTSGTSTPSVTDADLFTINLNNNGSSNYSYAVQPDGVIEQEYGSTRMIDLAVGKSGDQDVCEGDEKSDLIDFNAYSYDASSASAGKWFMSFTIDSSASLTSGTQQGYIIGLDTGTKGSPTIDLSASVTWQRNVAFPGDYFIAMYPSGVDTLSAGLYDSSRNAVANTTVTVVTKVVSSRRQIEVTLSGSGVPADLADNSAVNFLVMSVSNTNGDNVNDAIGSGITTECATGKTTYTQTDMRTSEAQCKAGGRPTDGGTNDRQCVSNPRRNTVNTINPDATCTTTTDSIIIDGAVDSGQYTLLAEDTYAGPYIGGQSALSDFDGESAAYKYYTDPNAGTSTSGLGNNLYDASTNGAKKGAADVEAVYARADNNYLYLIVEGPSALGGAGSMAGEPLDRSNLFIALDTPLVTSSTDTGGTASETANAPASRRVNFRGWAPDYVIEVVWAGDNTTTTNVHLHNWSSGTTWTNAGSFTTVLSQGTGTATGARLFGRAAFGTDGDRKGRFEFAIRWSQIGGIVGSANQIKIGVYTTGDSNLGTVNADDWDVFDQGPGIGQGCTGLGCHERIGDDPGDGDSGSQTGGESDETAYVGQTDTTTDVEPASDRASRDVDTIEGYYVFQANAQLLNCSPLAVALATFTASATPAGVTLAWETVSETDNAGFNLYRAASEAGPWARLNAALIPAAAPGASEGHAYTWVDATAQPGAPYVYRLESVALDGTTEVMDVAGVTGRPVQRRWLPLLSLRR